MSTKKAKLNLDFGHGGVSMNFAMENEIQPRDGLESDWSVGTLSFNSEEFEDFPGNSHERVDENRIKAIADSIEKTISEWQKEHGFDFDSLMEVTISAHFYDVLFFPYSPEFSKFKDITESDIKKIDERRQSYKVSQIVGENLKSLTSPYYNILDEKSLTARVSNPLGKRAKSLGFDTYFITNHPMLLRLLEVMKEDGETIKVSLSCEREFRALANKKEKESKTALVHITDSLSEFSVWEKSELKYLNKKETGLRELREMLWRLCLCYHKNPKLAERDFELRQNAEQMQKFYDMVKKAEVSDDSKELLSADDCLDLLESASCILESESWENFEYDRLGLPGKSNAKNKMTISNYVLCYFVREVIRNLLLEIKKTMYNDDFCKPECVVLECPIPLKGIESLASEVFE
ncbi:MAG: hypothetical protein LBB36_03135, partial [Fibromonadaceae bacterium]|nr:hypothetical protein [Fibromonadaceae bacterium]